jgi:hypothetical protein
MNRSVPLIHSKTQHPTQNTNSLLTLLFLIVFFGGLSILLGQDINPDLRNYHLYNGFAAFHHRMNYDLAPALMQTYLNPFFDCINYLLIALHRPMLTAFLLGAFSGVIGFILHEIGAILFQDQAMSDRRIYNILTLVIGLSGAASVALIGTTTNDTKMTVMVMLSLYFLLKANASGQQKFLYLAGFTAGLVLAFKLVAAVYFLGLFLALWFVDLKKLPFIAAAVIGFFIANGYWMWLLFKNFHSPIYPLYNNIFHSPYAPFITFNFKPTAAAAIKLGFADYLLMPLRLGWSTNTYISNTMLRDIHLGVVFILTLIFVTQQHVKPRVTRHQSAWTLVLTFFMSSYVLWLVILGNFRYSLPLEALSGLVMIYFAKRIFPTVASAQIFLCGVVLAIGATTVYPTLGRAPFQKDYFFMDTPVIPNHAEILMKLAPIAYVVPYFPLQTQFVGMQYVQLDVNENQLAPAPHKLFSNFLAKLNADIKTRPVYTLGMQEEDRYSLRTQKILKLYGYTEDKSACQKFATNIGDQLELCPLHFTG